MAAAGPASCRGSLLHCVISSVLRPQRIPCLQAADSLNCPSIDEVQRRCQSGRVEGQGCAVPAVLICWHRKLSSESPDLTEKLPEGIKPQNTEKSPQ